MHSPTVPAAIWPSRFRRIALRLPAFVLLIFSLTGSVLPGFAQGTGPTVSSIVLAAGATSTDGAFTVTFNEAVTGVSSDDFQAYATGGTGAAISAVTGSGTTWRVAFNYTGASGSLQMAIRTSGTGITNAAGVAFAGVGVTASAPVENVNGPTDMAPPSATITGGTATGFQVPFTVTFNEAVTGVAAADFVAITSTGVTASIGAPTGTGASYTIPVTFTGTGTIQLRLVGGATTDIRDATGHVMASAATSPSVSVTDTGGASAPVMASQTTTGTANSVFNYQVAATGATSISIIGAPSLPAGLSMSTSGLITGTPTTAGSTTVNLRATNAAGSTNATLGITIAPAGGGAPFFNEDQSISVTVGTPVNHQLVATGTPSFSIIGSPLPTGLTMSESGVITGTPTTVGTSTVFVRVTNASGSHTGRVTIAITASGAPAAPVIVGISDDTGTPGDGITSDYSLTVRGTAGANLTITLRDSGNPIRMTQSDAAGNWSMDLAYNPASSPLGSLNYTATATNLAGLVSAPSAPLVVWLVAPPSVFPIAPQFAVGQTVSLDLKQSITGGMVPTTISTSALPPGLTLNAESVIVGVPTAAGNYPVTITGSNGAGADIEAVTFTIHAVNPTTPPVIANQSAAGVINTPFNYAVVASSAWGYAALDQLPAGLVINNSTGVITGTPTVSGTTQVQLRAGNPVGGSTAMLTITISGAPDTTPPVPPVIATITNDTGTAGDRITTDGTLVFGGTAENNSTVTLSRTGAGIIGTATASATGAWSVDYTATALTPGSYAFTATARDAAGNVSPATAAFTVTVQPMVAGVPVVTAATISGSFGTPINFQIQATNTPGNWTASSALPPGLVLNSSTGVIAGTPTAASNAAVDITASNALGSGTGTITFAISGAPSGGGGGGPIGGGGSGGSPVGGGGGGASLPQTITFPPIANAVVGVPINLSASSSVGMTPVTFQLISGDATLSGSTLTPNATGSIVVRASQAGGGVFLPAFAQQTIAATATQSIAFNSPVSALTINTPVQLGALASSGLPVTFSVISGNATISGNTLTPFGLGPITVRASQPGNASFAATSTEVDFGSPQKAAQAITLDLGDVTVASGPIPLAANSSAGLPITYSVSGPARLNGNVLAFTGTPGVVTVRAVQGGSALYHPAAEVTRTFNVRALGQQVYLGNMGSDTFAVVISADNTKGMFLSRIAATGEAIVARFALNADGSFSANGTGSLPAADPAGTPPTAALTAPRTITGTVSNGTVTGRIAELDANFTATVAPATGPTATMAGVYIASTPGSASGETYIVAGPTGQAYAIAVTPSGVTSGTGTISSSGVLNITTSSGGTIVGNVDPVSGAVNGNLSANGRTAAFVGLSEGTARTDRLVNLSSRLRVVSGDASRSVIAGFVISGNENKQVLVRAVGPGLNGFGVTGALANPRLQLYHGSTLVAENDDWNNSTAVSTTGDSVGAFKLNAGSADSALVANLAPGAYTAVVSGAAGDGVALIEVYDAASNAPLSSSQQLVNISTRGFVDTGEGNLIAGFVVTGNAPKRVLIRGIGPSLTQFGVPGVVADPNLKIYAAGSEAVIAQNDDWASAQAAATGQVAATAAEVTAAATATGAFPLAANSKDAAIVITLMPGAYSAVVSGANNSTGAGLVEVYELTNP